MTGDNISSPKRTAVLFSRLIISRYSYFNYAGPNLIKSGLRFIKARSFRHSEITTEFYLFFYKLTRMHLGKFEDRLPLPLGQTCS